MIQGIIFDLDGVLVDGKEWHYEALNRALEPHHFQISREEHLKIYDGMTTKRKLQLLSEKKGLPVHLHDLISRNKQKHTFDLIQSHCEPNPIHIATLERLKKEGYRLALASNSIRNSVDLMLRKTKLIKYFDFTLSNEDVCNPKPSPEIYQKAIEKLGLLPSECLVIEDNEKGIQAAKRAQTHLLIVTAVNEVNYENITNSIYEKSPH